MDIKNLFNKDGTINAKLLEKIQCDVQQGRINPSKMLEEINPFELMEKIKHFNKLNLFKISDEELHEKIYDVLTFNGKFVFVPYLRKYEKGTKFFRVRKLYGSVIPFKELQIIGDFWSPPSEFISKYGRLNRPSESILYTSMNEMTAIQETKVQVNEYFALIKYIAKDEVKTNVIGGEYNYNELKFSEKSMLVHEIYNNFLLTEFSRDVGEGTEYIYRASEKIAKDFFDLPPRDMQDAWEYCSIKDKNFYNVAFRPEIAESILILQGAAICILDEKGNVIPKAIAYMHEKSGKVNYYEIGSEIQKKLFPEIVANEEIL